MSLTINSDGLQEAIQSIVENYTDEVHDIVQEEEETAIRYAVKELKRVSPSETGRYRKGWKSKIIKGRTETSAVAYNAESYQLTHLLEFGHANKRGGRTIGRVQAYPHIEKVNEDTARKFFEGVVKRL